MTQEETKELLQPFLQRLQDQLSKIIGVTVAVCKVINKDGEICFRLTKLPKACQMIMETEKGMAGCNSSCRACNMLVKEKEEAMLVQCHIGFLGFYFPIFVEGQKIGAITGCAGLIPEEISQEGIKEKYLKIAEDYGVQDKESFIQEIMSGVKVIPKERMNENLFLLRKVVEEVIGVYKQELKSALT
jgi:ligand-binding sensor protein